MKIFLLSTLLFFSPSAFSQSTALYDAYGALNVDNQFKITKNALLKAPTIEKELLPSIYNNLKYPAEARENNFGGIVIVKFTCFSGKTSFEIVKYSDGVFKNAVDRFLKLRPEKYFYDKIGKYGDILFYLPIKFQMINGRFKETLSVNKMLTIEAIDAAPEAVVIDDSVLIKK